MYYNKKRVNQQLEEGIEDPAGTIEDLYVFINQIIDVSKVRQVNAELQDYIDEWEG